MTMLLGTLGVKLDALTAEFEKDMEEAKSKVEEIAETAKKVAVAAGAAFVAMAAGIAVASKAFDTQIRAERGLEAAFKARGEAADIEGLKELAGALQDITAVGDEAILTAAKLLVPFGATEEAVKKLLPGLLDVAAGMDIDLKTATLAAGKALSGQAGALSRYVGKLTDAQTAILQTGNESQKLAVIQQVLAKFQGQAALAASTAAGQFKHVSGRLGDMTEKIGEMLDKPLAAVLNVVQLALKRVDTFLGNLSPEFKEWAGTIMLVITALTGVTAVVASLIALGPVLIGMFSAVGAAMLTAFLPVVIILAIVAAAILSVLFTIGTLKKAWDSNLFGMRDTLQSFVKHIKVAWEFLRDGFIEALKTAKTVGEKILASIGEAIEDFVNAHIGIVRELGEAIGSETLAGLGDVSIDLTFEDIDTTTKGLKDAILDGLEAGAEFTLDSLAEGFGIAKEVLKPIFDTFSDAVKDLGEAPPTVPGAQPGVAPGVPPEDEEPTEMRPPEEFGRRGATTVLAETEAAREAVTSGLGAFGRIIEILATKGPIAAIIAVIAEALATTATFGKIIARFGDLLVNIGRAFEPLLAAIFPLFDIAVDLASAFVQLFVKFNPLFAILVLLAPAFLKFAEVLDFVLRKTIQGFNWVINVIASVLGAIPVIGDDLKAIAEQFLIDIQPAAVVELGGSVVELGDEAGDAADNMAAFNDTLRDVNEELSNVPEGFKVAAARFKALDEELGTVAPGGAAVEGGVTAGTIGTLIESVVIQALDPDDAWRQLKGAAERDNFLTGGTIIGKTSRLAVEGKGGF